MSIFFPQPELTSPSALTTIMDNTILSHSLTLSATPLRFTLMLLVVMFSASVQANTALQAFPLAQLESSKSSTAPQYSLAVGRIQNKSGGAAPEHWLQLPQGQLQQKTYRITSSKDTDKIFQHYRAQLQHAGDRIVFECSSRECGSSIDWANQVFKVSTLYGVDRKQHYIAAQRHQGEVTEFFAVYVTERGTGRIYVQEETYQVKTAALTSEASVDVIDLGLYQQLSLHGWMSLPVAPDGSYEDLVAERLNELVRQLNQDQNQYWLVAHHYGQGSDQALLKRSEQAAQHLLQQLNQMGLVAGKLSIKALGALAPTKDSIVYGGRLELVRQKVE